MGGMHPFLTDFEAKQKFRFTAYAAPNVKHLMHEDLIKLEINFTAQGVGFCHRRRPFLGGN